MDIGAENEQRYSIRNRTFHQFVQVNKDDGGRAIRRP